MNKKNIISIIRTLSLVVCGVVFFASCDNEEQLSTDILNSKETTLNAYGPNPALRGSKLSFAGSHLDKITKVILPDNIEITDIEVVSDKVIKFVIPQEAKEGIVRLVGPNNLELVGADSLTISEPVSITNMSPSPVKAGQVLTLEGDYFNLIQKVIFTDKVEVAAEDFKTWSRTKIEVVLPAEAQSGIIILSDTAEIPLEYQSPEALQVVLPSVNAVQTLNDRKPGEVITAPGKDLDLIVRLEMPNGAETPFTTENNTLTFTLPEGVTDGAIAMIPASGVRVAVANIGIAMPGKLVVTPSTGLRGGSVITIKGVNLELVTTIAFPGVDEAVTPTSKSATEIKVAMPEKAVSGEMVLNTASGKTVSALIATLKPDVSAYNPSPASAGSDLKLQGHNLDLVTTVTFAENLVVEATPSRTSELTVRVPLNAVSGAVVLTMANGETVECKELEVTAPVLCYILNPPGPKAEIYAGGVLTVEVANGDKLTDIKVGGASVKFIHDAPKLYIVIPGNANGDTELKLISSNGEAVYTIPVIGSGDIETVLLDELTEISWSNTVRLYKESFEGLAPGAILKFYIASAGSGAQLALQDANWEKLTLDDPNFDAQWGTLTIPEGSTSYEIVLTKAVLDKILAVDDGWSTTAIIIAGQNVIVSKISVIVKGTATETTLVEGDTEFSWSMSLRINKEHLSTAKAGSMLKFYFSSLSDNAQIKLQDANWATLTVDTPEFDAQWGTITVPPGSDAYEIPLTQALLDVILSVDDGWSTTAIIANGQNLTVSKVTLIDF
ncbi:MAG: hypothetical protein LBT42_07540 [Tannerella sp.]|jgi:hypothetical protein|nr:hypothetical protein [Tannerella sp.]